MYIFFDIETTDKDPKTCDFKCAVAVDSNKTSFLDGVKVATYLAHDDNADAMSVTFNGLNFDFQVMPLRPQRMHPKTHKADCHSSPH